MEKIAPGKFEVTLAGETKVVCVSFGVRSEILRIITKKQLEYRNISAKNMLSTEMRAKLAEQVEALDAERNKEEKNQARIDELQNSVNEIYEASIKIIDENKDKITEQLAVGMIDLTDDAMAEILALVLTERDSEGKATKNITKDAILHGEKYAEDSDELLSLIEGIMIYLTAALQKIQTISLMLSSLVRND
jgi:hypothetical protein